MVAPQNRNCSSRLLCALQPADSISRSFPAESLRSLSRRRASLLPIYMCSREQTSFSNSPKERSSGGPQSSNPPRGSSRADGIRIACILMAATTASAATRTVNAGGDLQAAFNAAQPGDEIVLQAGARFTGSFYLPTKPDGARHCHPIVGDRCRFGGIEPANASLMPTIALADGRTGAVGHQHVQLAAPGGIRVRSKPVQVNTTSSRCRT